MPKEKTKDEKPKLIDVVVTKKEYAHLLRDLDLPEEKVQEILKHSKRLFKRKEK
jgi:hypothetical protein